MSEENELIDYDVFGQILDMDEEGDNEFSKSIVYNYFEQAEATFKDMLDALEKKDLPNLSRLGHFLKGSSAALGLKMVKEMCEKIQHYGSLKDASGVNPIGEEEALASIETCLTKARNDYKAANKYLKDFYEEEEEEEIGDDEGEEAEEEEEVAEKGENKKEEIRGRKNSQESIPSEKGNSPMEHRVPAEKALSPA